MSETHLRGNLAMLPSPPGAQEENMGAGLQPQRIFIVSRFLFVCLAAIFAVGLRADTYWNGGSGLWRSGPAWSNGTEPNSATDVFIDNGKTTVASTATVDLSANCHNLTIDIGDALVAASAGSVGVTGNATVNGLIQVVSGALAFTGSGGAALSGVGTIQLGSNVQTTGGGGFLANNTGGTLTIGSGILVHGFGMIHTLTSVMNQGRISADISGLPLELSYVNNQGVIEASNGAHLFLYGGGDNTGTLRVTSGALMKLSGLSSVNGLTFTNNRGSVEVSDGGELQFQGGYNAETGAISVNGGTLTIPSSPSGAWQNRGNISLNNAVLNLQNSLVTDDLGSIIRTGTGMTNLSATLTNTGHVLALDSPANSWTLLGGTILNGTVSTANGAQFLSKGGSLDGVTLNAFVAMVPLTGITNAGDRQLTVRNGLVVDNGTVEVAADDSHSASLIFTGVAAQVVGGSGQIFLGPAGANAITITREIQHIPQLPPVPLPVGDVTFGPHILIHGVNGSIGVASDARFTNQGTILADTVGGVVQIDNLTNEGLIQAKSGATVNLLSGFSQTVGTLLVEGNLLSSSNPLIIGGTLGGTGTINAAVRVQGDLSPGGGGQEIGTLTLNGDLAFAPGSRLAAQLGATRSDSVKVIGNLDLTALGDSLELTEIEAVPAGTSQLLVSYTGNLSGTFDTVTDGFTVSYATPHEVWVSSVPEPSTVWALGSALAILATRAKRRTKPAALRCR